MKRWVLGLLLMATGAISAFAQSGGGKVTVSGTVVDGTDKSPVIQAGVQVLSVKDSSVVAANVTDVDGKFRVAARPGKYLLKISYIGYQTASFPASSKELNRIVLKEDNKIGRAHV